MRNRHGSFVWCELLAGDTAAAGRFYAGLLGWQVGEAGGEVAGYRLFRQGAHPIAGLMPAPAGVRPGWFGYIGVEDVDAAVERITRAGGVVQMPARDLAGVGRRLAMLADPQGAPFYVIRGASDQPSPSFDRDAVGHCAWSELATRDPDAALEFYAHAFGWTPGELLPMGEAGGYQILLLAGEAFGGLRAGMDGEPPMWSFYFRVPAIGAAVRRAQAGGALLLHGPAEVPGGDQIVIATDPQGALFALVGRPG